ncbi:MAG: mechanosensitive ion channel [Alphaproteobacteria bacterium]|nr:MAG: mechanosensitive ion channel [Alphaproteobacteria bacterium]
MLAVSVNFVSADSDKVNPTTNTLNSQKTTLEDLADKITSLEQKIDSLEKSKPTVQETKQIESSTTEIVNKEQITSKNRVVFNNIKRIAQNIFTTLMSSFKFVFSNADSLILLKRGFINVFKLAVLSVLISYILFFALKRSIHYYHSIYENQMYSLFSDFSVVIFSSLFLLCLIIIPELEFSLINQASFLNSETMFILVTLNRLLISFIMIRATQTVFSYIQNDLIQKTSLKIISTVTFMCVTWCVSEITKYFIAIYEVSKMDAKVIEDISLVTNIVYTSILLKTLLTLRQNISTKLRSQNIWLRNLTGIHSIALVLVYIIIIFWTNMNISYKFIRTVASVILFPIALLVSILVRRYISHYLISIKPIYRFHILPIYLPLLKIIRKAVIPVVIITTLKIWEISIYKNIISIVNKRIVDGLISIFYLMIVYNFLLGLVRHILAKWLSKQLAHQQDNNKKFEILFQILLSGSKIIFGFAAFIGTLSILGYNTTHIVPALTFLSAGLSLSVREIITDLLNGLFIIIDNTIVVGDMVVIHDKNAQVENMTLRYMQARRDDGTLITIPYHKVDEIMNKSRNFMGVLINVAVTYDTKPEEAIATVEEAFNILREMPQCKHRVFIPFEMRGLAEVNGVYYTVYAKIKVVPGYQFMVQRNLNRIIKELFDKKSIKMPDQIRLTHIKSPSTTTPLPDSVN